MTGSDAGPAAADRARVQRSAVRVGLWVGLASVAIVGAITAITVVVMLATSRPELRPPDRDGDGGGGRRWDDRVVDLSDVLPVAVILGLVGVVALAVVAWYTARRAARPLAQALSAQRAFVADASHELRTPLTTLTSRVQLAQHRAERGGDVQPVLADLRRDAAVMDAVLTDLLVAAEAGGPAAGDSAAATSVEPAVRSALDLIAPQAERAGVHLALGVPPGLEAAADTTALTRAVVALLDNAVRFSPSGGTVSVTARAAGRRMELRVADQGPGIAGDPERLFERFARADDAPRAAGGRGFGLGLALVRDIATRFSGTVTVESTSASGTTFLLNLPVAHR